jgi:hypothetical protein
MINAVGRHEATVHMCAMLEPNVNLPQPGRDIAVRFAELTQELLAKLPDGDELVIGLRKLLEAKDCMVRHAVLTGDPRLGWEALRA